MYAQEKQPKENISSSVTNSVGQRSSTAKLGVGIINRRPAILIQKQMKQLINRKSESRRTLKRRTPELLNQSTYHKTIPQTKNSAMMYDHGSVIRQHQYDAGGEINYVNHGSNGTRPLSRPTRFFADSLGTTTNESEPLMQLVRSHGAMRKDILFGANWNVSQLYWGEDVLNTFLKYSTPIGLAIEAIATLTAGIAALSVDNMAGIGIIVGVAIPKITRTVLASLDIIEGETNRKIYADIVRGLEGLAALGLAIYANTGDDKATTWTKSTSLIFSVGKLIRAAVMLFGPKDNRFVGYLIQALQLIEASALITGGIAMATNTDKWKHELAGGTGITTGGSKLLRGGHGIYTHYKKGQPEITADIENGSAANQPDALEA